MSSGRGASHNKRRLDMLYVLMWLLGVPLTLIVLLFLLGIGR
jgi:hypothetical protein